MFKVGFVGGSSCLWCLKSRWSPPLGVVVTLKIGKNGLEVKKVGVRLFLQKIIE
jgi:hypothetical protein